MTLDEAIEHAREKAEENRKGATYNFPTLSDYYYMCLKCAEEHEQLAEWLEELKKYREMNIVHCKDCKHWGSGVAGETENVKCCEYGKYMVGENGYCVYGERGVKWRD